MAKSKILGMSDNDFSHSDAIRKTEEQGLVFSEDKEKLKMCTNTEITEVVISDGITKIGEGGISWVHWFEQYCYSGRRNGNRRQDHFWQYRLDQRCHSRQRNKSVSVYVL